MKQKYRLALAVLAVAGVLGCGDADSPAPAGTTTTAPADDGLATVAAEITRACRRVAADGGIAVLCPQRLPAMGRSRLTVTSTDKNPERCSYLIDLNNNDERGGAPFHVLIGGANPGYSLRTRQGQWPAEFPAKFPADDEDPLRLVAKRPLVPGQRHEQATQLRTDVVRSVTAFGRPALILRMRPYPVGGLSGGHLVLLTNRSSTTYALSVHWREQGTSVPPEAKQLELLLKAASSMRPIPAGERC